MRVYSLFWFVLSCWDFPTQIVSYNVIVIFENLTMSSGAVTWVENFWNYDAKVIDYWTILFTTSKHNIARLNN